MYNEMNRCQVDDIKEVLNILEEKKVAVDIGVSPRGREAPVNTSFSKGRPSTKWFNGGNKDTRQHVKRQKTGGQTPVCGGGILARSGK